MGNVASRDSRKESAWRRRLSRQAESGQSIRSWCREHQVTEAAFYWWRKELARRDAEVASPSFVPVHVAEEPVQDSDGQIEIVLTDGRRLRVTGLVNRRMLTEVLEALALVNAAAGERRTC